ncbi:MAG: hypothetical protein KF906_03095 [Actinobacteria bacterium]|nr:hypothetical protein [Actinomycetota bacterium]
MQEFAVWLLEAAVLGAALVGWFVGTGGDADAPDVWCRSHGVPATPATLPLVRWYLRLSATSRGIGGVAGVLVGAGVDQAFGVDTSAGYGFWAWVIAGWMLGAAWAERRIDRPGEPGTATLVPRRLTDYLSNGLLLAPAGVTLLVAVAALLGTGAPFPVDPLFDRLGDGALLGSTLASAGVALLAFSIQVDVVARRQPASSAEVLAVDDAIRSSTVHQVGGAATAVCFCILGAVLVGVVIPIRSLPLGIRGWVPMLPVAGILATWRFWAYWPWHVRRTVAVVTS